MYSDLSSAYRGGREREEGCECGTGKKGNTNKILITAIIMLKKGSELGFGPHWESTQSGQVFESGSVYNFLCNYCFPLIA